MTPNILLNIFISSIPGTIVMTLFMYFYSAFFKKETRVIHIFGSMITGDIPARSVSGKGKSLIAGTVAHFMVGFVLAFTYYILIDMNVFVIRFADGLILGILSGIVAVIVWRAYIFLHFHPPRIEKAHYFIALFIAHIFFAVFTIYTFYFFQRIFD